MENRHEWVKCIKKTDTNNLSWCGRDITREWHFVDVDHAALNGNHKGRLVACIECAGYAMAGLTNGHDGIDDKQ